MDNSEKALSRDEQRARRLLSKAVAGILKQMARGTGWRSAQTYLFREHEGWLVYIDTHVSLLKLSSAANLRIKPLGIDPIFWDIVSLPENNSLPTSFRIFGAWTCSVPVVHEAQIPPDCSNPETIADYVLRWSSMQLRDINFQWTTSRFLSFLQSHPRQKEAAPWLAAEVATLALLNDDERAIGRCYEACDRKWHGGFTVMGSSGARSFVDLAIEWFEQRMADKARH